MKWYRDQWLKNQDFLSRLLFTVVSPTVNGNVSQNDMVPFFEKQNLSRSAKFN
jgi:hypothetical protein